MSREFDPLLPPDLKQAAVNPSLHWTDIALLTVIAKGNNAIVEAELNMPRHLSDCRNAVDKFARAASFHYEGKHLEMALRDANQLLIGAKRLQKQIVAMRKKVIQQRHPKP